LQIKLIPDRSINFLYYKSSQEIMKVFLLLLLATVVCFAKTAERRSLGDDEIPAYLRKSSAARKGVERQASHQNFSYHTGGITSGSKSASRKLAMLPADVVPAYVKNARKSMKKVETKAANKRFQYSEIGRPKRGSKSADEAAKAAKHLKTAGKLAVVKTAAGSKATKAKKSSKVKYSNKKFKVGMAKGERIPMKVQKAIERIGAKPKDTKKGAVGKYHYLLVHITKIEGTN
jgi:hypothetical protein